MQNRVRPLLSLLFALLFTASALAQAASTTHPLRFHVTLDGTAVTKPVSGRLIIFMSKEKPQRERLQPGFGTDAEKTFIAAQEVSDWKPGSAVEMDPDLIAYPKALSNAPAGKYWVMALLDHNHNAAYRTYDGGDVTSEPIEFTKAEGATKAVDLRVSKVVPERKAELPKGAEIADFVSPSLTAFWGREIHMRAVVLLPANYKNSTETFPTVYETHGFTGNLQTQIYTAAHYADVMSEQGAPQMIMVFLDESFPSGTHEFADSVNNGPWGHALTTEFIPFLESKYRMDAKPSGRFLTGHSSGGWATLWLQTRYPEFFGGTWSTSPDPSDFRDFTGPDITKPGANVYRKPDGSRWMLMREGNKDVESLQDFAQQEDVLGEYGGQMSSFEWVFSPRGEDGRPMELFDRKTGNVDPDVAKYWVNNYDIANLVRKRWAEIGPSLKGKVHVIVGTLDTFHLEGPAHKLDAVLKELGADAKFTYIEGRNHMNLYEGGLENKILREIYAVARPQAGASH